MKLDDSHNDYFLEPETPGQEPETAPKSGSTISFNDPEPASPQAPKPVGKHRGRKALIWFIVIVTLILTVAFWLRYLNPYVTEARATGYVVNVEKRGIICKTFEGELVTESQLADTTRVYSRDFTFCVPNDSLARALQALQGTSKRVTLVYEKYYGTLPWRGASSNVVVGMDD